MPRPEPDNTLEFRLHIRCENAAFEDFPEGELATILRAVADRLEQENGVFDTCRNLYDANGNEAGNAALKTAYEHDNARHHDRKAYLAQRGAAR